jgi:hypothetical protein
VRGDVGVLYVADGSPLKCAEAIAVSHTQLYTVDHRMLLAEKERSPPTTSPVTEQPSNPTEIVPPPAPSLTESSAQPLVDDTRYDP